MTVIQTVDTCAAEYDLSMVVQHGIIVSSVGTPEQ